MQTPYRRSDKFKKVDTGPVFLTPEGHGRLKKELVDLKRALPTYIAEAQRTAAHGDRSDNAEYKQAKGILRRANWRILEVEDQLKRVSVIPSSQGRMTAVQLGATVVIELKNGERKTFRILGSKETNPENGFISFQSPLGAALMNKKKNDLIRIETPGGISEYRILEIK